MPPPTCAQDCVPCQSCRGSAGGKAPGLAANRSARLVRPLLIKRAITIQKRRVTAAMATSTPTSTPTTVTAVNGPTPRQVPDGGTEPQ